MDQPIHPIIHAALDGRFLEHPERVESEVPLERFPVVRSAKALAERHVATEIFARLKPSRYTETETALNVDDGPVMRRTLRQTLLPLPQRHNHCDAAGPRRQQIGHRQKFEREGRQQQRMKSEDSPRQDHRGNVEKFIREYPSDRACHELEHVGRYADREGEQDAVSRENRRLSRHLTMEKPPSTPTRG